MRTLIAVVLLSLLPSLASAQYTTKKIDAVDQPDDKGQVHVVVKFTGPNVKMAVRDYYPTDDQSFREQVAADLADLNKKRLTTKDLIVGTDVPDPSGGNPPGPTPSADDLAVVAFQGLVNTWLAAIAEQKIGQAQQSDVDAAKEAMAMPFQKANPAVRARMDLVLVAVTRGSGIQ